MLRLFKHYIPHAVLLLGVVETTGVTGSDLSSFPERETGRIDLGGVNPSWLVVL